MKGKHLMEAAAKAASDYHKNPKAHEAHESASHEAAEAEGMAEMDDQLCPACHEKMQRHLAKMGHNAKS